MAKIKFNSLITVDIARTIMFELDELYPKDTFWFASEEGDLNVPEFMHVDIYGTDGGTRDDFSDYMEIGAYIQRRQTELLINHG